MAAVPVYGFAQAGGGNAAEQAAATARAAMMVGTTSAPSGTVHYYYTDPQGTVLAETDVSGNITATFDYAPYGTQAMGTAPNGPGYTGHVNDPDTGLVYMQARYYDPTTGQFLSTDPVPPATGNLFNFNRYAYANNNPIVNIDPDGRCVDADWSCGAIGRSFGDHPEAAKPMVPYAFAGLGVMVTASGAGGAVALIKGAATLDKILVKAEQLSKNVEQGAKAERAVAEKLGDQVAGKRVTLESSTGQRSVADIVTKDKGVVEVKSGGGRLSPGQKAVKADIDAGRPVTPRGKNAADAGLEPGQPTSMKCYQVDRC